MSNNHSTFESQVVLVVDDDKEILTYVSSILSCLDITVCEASTEKEALETLNKITPDIILLDIHLPDGSGQNIIRKLRTENKHSSIPILIITSDSSENTVNEVYQLGIYDFIEKPLTPSLLINRLKKAINNKLINTKFSSLKNKLHQLQHVAGLGYWEYDSGSEEFKCSDELFEMLGLNKFKTNFTLYSFLSHTHEDDVEIVGSTLMNATQNATPFSLEHKIYDKNNNEIIVLHQGEVQYQAGSNHFNITATITDITERRQTQNLIEYTSLHDKLTGLPNRSYFCDHLSTLMNISERDEKLLGLIFVGIDRFKNINESLGHNVGDELLAHLTSRFNTLHDCFIARFSGDVFAIAIKNMSNFDQATHITTQISEMVSTPFEISGHDIYITVSMGMSIYPINNADKDQFISNAESAMHYSKNTGGNHISCFESSMVTNGKSRLFIENDLRKAIDKEQFEVFYQPQVSVINQRLIGMEALIRWNHPVHGLIGPDDFIPIAEETGLILPIGEWVMEQATNQASNWTKQGYGMLRIGINISPMQFDDKRLPQKIETFLSSSGLMPCSIDLELTESSAMRDIKQTIKTLNVFKEMGIQTSLDDFGTGYSSLSYLHMMPLHTLKIDRSFIRNINHKGENGELAKMIISMCHALGLNVIAEGVETNDHLTFLRNLDCAEAQGYLFSRPVNVRAFENILNQYSNADISYDLPKSEFFLR